MCKNLIRRLRLSTNLVLIGTRLRISHTVTGIHRHCNTPNALTSRTLGPNTVLINVFDKRSVYQGYNYIFIRI